MPRDFYDVIIVGGGPAGATCAAFCAQLGFKTLVLEKASFPRDKVCGDCINPSCWPILERLEIAERLLSLPHSKLEEVEFIGLRGRSIKFPLTKSSRGEIAIPRALFDELLRERAVECGVEFLQSAAVTSIERGWKIHTSDRFFECRSLVAADGRNSTAMRLLGLMPPSLTDRVALQTHIAAPDDFGERVVLRFLPEGYCGIASVGNGRLNLCLVSRPREIAALKAFAEKSFSIPARHAWRTIAPLSRAAIAPWSQNLLVIGDAARVVEPFTGEGIYYAMASGELAAKHLRAESAAQVYAMEHAQLYRGRLWVNRVARCAVLEPRLGSFALDVLRWHPPALRFLTAKVMGEAVC